MRSYGYCPVCGEKVVMRERRMNGNDKCEQGHTFPSKETVPNRPFKIYDQGSIGCSVGYAAMAAMDYLDYLEKGDK